MSAVSPSSAVSLHGVDLVHADGAQALAAIDLGLAVGERVAVIGPSGAGKTSLLRVLATSLTPSRGRVEVLGRDPWALSRKRRQRLRAGIGLIHQAPPLPPRQRIVTAVAAGRLGSWGLMKSLINLLHPVDSGGVHAALERLDLEDKLFHRCDQLSGGQLQRIGVARVLYQRPQLILADEPVASLDPVLAEHTLRVLIGDAATRGVTLVASLHAVELARAHFDRIVGLRDGKILFDRAVADVTDTELKALYANARLPARPVQQDLDYPSTPSALRVPLC